jgi:hypothetical protein
MTDFQVSPECPVCYDALTVDLSCGSCGWHPDVATYRAVMSKPSARTMSRLEQALDRVLGENAGLRERLHDIATREWRDEGGRIAAAIARDALASVSPKGEA